MGEFVVEMMKIDDPHFGPTYWKQVTEEEYLQWEAGLPEIFERALNELEDTP